MNKENYLIKFEKPVNFEGKKYEEIDLSALENATITDMIETEKILSRQGSYYAVQEASMEYVCVLAAKVTKLPIEFFNSLPVSEGRKVKTVVRNFLYPQD